MIIPVILWFEIHLERKNAWFIAIRKFSEKIIEEKKNVDVDENQEKQMIII